MAYYENVFIARQDISAPQVDALMETFAGVITAGGGSVSKKEYWGLKNFAYRMQKHRKGHYVLFNIDAPSAAVKEMERQMGIHEDVVRYLTVRVENLEEGPSAILRNKDRERGERSERGERGGFGDRPRREFGGRPRRDDRGGSQAEGE